MSELEELQGIYAGVLPEGYRFVPNEKGEFAVVHGDDATFEQGWKLHLSIAQGSLVPALRTVIMPILFAHRVKAAKIAYGQTLGNILNPSHPQAGKVVTIGDSGSISWSTLVHELEIGLARAGIKPGPFPIEGDKPITGSHYICYRNAGEGDRFANISDEQYLSREGIKELLARGEVAAGHEHNPSGDVDIFRFIDLSQGRDHELDAARSGQEHVPDQASSDRITPALEAALEEKITTGEMHYLHGKKLNTSVPVLGFTGSDLTRLRELLRNNGIESTMHDTDGSSWFHIQTDSMAQLIHMLPNEMRGKVEGALELINTVTDENSGLELLQMDTTGIAGYAFRGAPDRLARIRVLLSMQDIPSVDGYIGAGATSIPVVRVTGNQMPKLRPFIPQAVLGDATLVTGQYRDADSNPSTASVNRGNESPPLTEQERDAFAELLRALSVPHTNGGHSVLGVNITVAADYPRSNFAALGMDPDALIRTNRTQITIPPSEVRVALEWAQKQLAPSKLGGPQAILGNARLLGHVAQPPAARGRALGREGDGEGTLPRRAAAHPPSN